MNEKSIKLDEEPVDQSPYYETNFDMAKSINQQRKNETIDLKDTKILTTTKIYTMICKILSTIESCETFQTTKTLSL